MDPESQPDGKGTSGTLRVGAGFDLEALPRPVRSVVPSEVLIADDRD